MVIHVTYFFTSSCENGSCVTWAKSPIKISWYLWKVNVDQYTHASQVQGYTPPPPWGSTETAYLFWQIQFQFQIQTLLSIKHYIKWKFSFPRTVALLLREWFRLSLFNVGAWIKRKSARFHLFDSNFHGMVVLYTADISLGINFRFASMTVAAGFPSGKETWFSHRKILSQLWSWNWKHACGFHWIASQSTVLEAGHKMTRLQLNAKTLWSLIKRNTKNC